MTFGSDAGNFGTNDFTIECWMKTTSTQPYETFLAKRVFCLDSAGYLDISLRGSAPGIVEYSFLSPGRTNNIDCFSTQPINDGLWHHLAFVRQRTNHSLYLDGQLTRISHQ